MGGDFDVLHMAGVDADADDIAVAPTQGRRSGVLVTPTRSSEIARSRRAALRRGADALR
jgi:hypothetical protein